MTNTLRRGDLILKAVRLTKRYGKCVVFDDLNLELRRGEIVLLRGENGSGKTTLLNILTGNLEPDAGCIEYRGNGRPRTFVFPQRLWRKIPFGASFAPELAAREGVGRTWQDIRLFASHTLLENVAVARPYQIGEVLPRALFPSTWSSDDSESLAIGRRSLRKLGLAGRYHLSASEVSLGQAKRAAISRALESKAEVLFLDEPLAGLDHQGAVEAVYVLAGLVKHHQKTLVICEHVLNQPLLAQLITTDWLLSGGTLAVTHELQSNSRRPEPLQSVWHALFESGAVKAERVGLPRGAILTRLRKRNTTAIAAGPALQVRGLIVSYNGRAVLGVDNDGQHSGLSFDVGPGEIAVLEAPNGWGKTTLARAIAGLLPNVEGDVVLHGRNVNELCPSDRQRLGLSTLLPDCPLFPGLTVAEVLNLAGRLQPPPDWAGLLDRRCSSLSGGERQRVAIRAALTGNVTVHDEPFLGLDGDGITSTIVRYGEDDNAAHLLLLPGAA